MRGDSIPRLRVEPSAEFLNPSRRYYPSDYWQDVLLRGEVARPQNGSGHSCGVCDTRSRMAHVLVVDDDKAQRVLVEEMLVPTGYTVESAKHGREALEKHHSRRADLVITDLFMPEFDGVELILALR